MQFESKSTVTSKSKKIIIKQVLNQYWRIDLSTHSLICWVENEPMQVLAIHQVCDDDKPCLLENNSQQCEHVRVLIYIYIYILITNVYCRHPKQLALSQQTDRVPCVHLVGSLLPLQYLSKWHDIQPQNSLFWYLLIQECSNAFHYDNNRLL